MEKTWIEVEMEETINLLRKKLEDFNNCEPDEINHDDLMAIKDIYKTLFYIESLKKCKN